MRLYFLLKAYGQVFKHIHVPPTVIRSAGHRTALVSVEVHLAVIDV